MQGQTEVQKPAVKRNTLLVLVPDPEPRERRTVVVTMCIKCHATLILQDFGTTKCCGQVYEVSETEGIIPDGLICG